MSKHQENPHLSDMLKVLTIGHVWPEPSSSAAGIRLLSLIEIFQRQRWLVTFVCAAKQTEFQTDLSARGINCHSVKLNDSNFDDYLTMLQPDIVLFDRFICEEQFGWRVEQHCPKALRILDTEDLHFLRHTRHEAVRKNRPLHIFDFNNALTKREIAAILRCDLSLVISPFEQELLHHFFGIKQDLICHHPIVVETIPSLNTLPTFEQRQHFLTIGNFKHAPNWDSVKLLSRYWPAIKEALPSAECHIYGAYTPDKAFKLHCAKSGFLIKGRASQASGVMSNARVCLAPLRFGAGVKGKLLQAMINATPSVTSSIGAEGMAQKQAWPGSVADSRVGFIDAAIKLYQDKTAWLQAQKNIEPYLKTLTPAQWENDLIFTIRKLRKQLSKHRERHFLGGLIRHHRLASTRYFSRWITQKNQNKIK